MSSSVASTVKQKGYINIHTKSEPVQFFWDPSSTNVFPFPYLALQPLPPSASVW